MRKKHILQLVPGRAADGGAVEPTTETGLRRGGLPRSLAGSSQAARQVGVGEWGEIESFVHKSSFFLRFYPTELRVLACVLNLNSIEWMRIGGNDGMEERIQKIVRSSEVSRSRSYGHREMEGKFA